MKFVYLLQSVSFPKRRYRGMTEDVPARLRKHNAGLVPSTARFRPRKIVVTICFQDDDRAARFEQYLKTGSGHVFANRHLW